MAGEIASAYVRIRPQMSGFRNETVAGVKSALTGVNSEVKAAGETQVAAADETIIANQKVRASYAEVGASAKEAAAGAEKIKGSVMGLGKIIGVAFGADIGFQFVKGIVGHAADIQKQIEVVKTEFGGASKALLDFGEKGGAALGISAHAADTAAARMGILFKNLGVGSKTAGAATLDLLKLAGSISAIRGIDPSIALKNLPLAIAGNLRSLKQLGISTDAAQLQVAAFKLGLTATITQALTPAQRALAITAVATAHLGDFQRQAAAHAGDLANVSRRLTAEWDNAKDKLGTSLLPIVGKLVTFLANTLPSAVSKTETAFGDFGATVKGIAGFIAPAFKPVLKVFDEIKSAFSSGGGGFGKLKSDFNGLSPAAKGAAIAVGALGVVIAATIAAAFPITTAVIAIVGLGIAFDEAYKHSAKFREIVGDLKTFITGELVPAVKSIAEKAAPAFAALWQTVQKVFKDIVVIVGQIVKAATAIWEKFGGTITRIAKDSFGVVITVISTAFKNIGLAFDAVKDLLTGKWSKLWGDLKGIVGNDLNAVKSVISAFGDSVAALFEGIWKAVQIDTLRGLDAVVKIASAIVGKITGALSAFTSFFGFGKVKNPLSGVADSLEKQISGIKSAAAAKALAEQTAKNTAAALKAKTTDPLGVESGVTEVTKKVTKKIKDAAAGAATTAGTAVATSAVDAGVKSAEQSLALLQTKLKETIAQNAIDIANAVRDAKSNLLQIASSLSGQVGQIIDQPFVVAQNKIQAAQDRLSLIYDSKNAKLEAQTQRLSRLQAQLGFLSDKHNLAMMRNEVLLPGGKSLSTDPTKALAQLKQLERSANQINRPAIDAFILQYRGALLQVSQDKLGLKQSGIDAKRQAAETKLGLKTDALAVAQDTANQVKLIAQRSIADFSSALASGAITLKTFNRKLAGLLAADHISYKRAGALLGTAFSTGFQANVTGIAKQAAAIAAGPHIPGTGQEPKIIRPEVTYQRDQLKVTRITNEIANKHLTIAKKIAASSAKAAKELEALNSVTLGPTATSLGHNPGKASKTTHEMSGTTG